MNFEVIKKVFFPPEQTLPYDYQKAVDATKLQRAMKVARVAAFAFTNFMFSTAGLIAQINFSLWPVSLGLAVVGFVALGIFFWLKHNEEHATKGLDVCMRGSLVKQEARRLFSEPKQANQTAESVEQAFITANHVLGFDLFDALYRKKLRELHEKASEGETLIDAAYAQGVSLNIAYEMTYLQSGDGSELKVNMRVDWDGYSAQTFDFAYEMSAVSEQKPASQEPVVAT